MADFVIAKRQNLTKPRCSEMEDSKEILKQEISNHFAADVSRIDSLARFLVAQLQVCTVNYAQSTSALNLKVKDSSNGRTFLFKTNMARSPSTI